MFDAATVVDAVKSIRGPGSRLLPWLATENDLLIMRQSLIKDPVGYRYVEMFESLLARECGVKHAVAVNSGTSAIHSALMALDIGEGDEVIVPALSFAGCAAAVTYTGASPHFVDCLHNPIGAINPYKLRRHLLTYGRAHKIKAVLAVDLLGHCSVMPDLESLCRERGIYLIEDAAAALGSSAFHRKAGSFGKVATISFNNNKIVTTNGGGAVLTDDDELALKIRHRARTAKKDSPWHYEHDQVGYNYRMPNICAALGIDQLVRLEELVKGKRFLAHEYHRAFVVSSDVSCVLEVPQQISNYWLNAIMVDGRHSDFAQCRDSVLVGLHAAGIASRALFAPLHLSVPYAHYPRQRDLAISEDLFNRVICLPSSI